MWLVLAAAAAAISAVQPQPGNLDHPAAPEPAQQVNFRSDPVLRLTVPVKIGGRTRRFLVDTAAEQSGISIELVRSLGLSTGAPSEVIGFAGSKMVPTVPIALSGFTRGRSSVLDALALSRDAIGADGFLGLDSLRGHVLVIDFSRQEMTLRRTPRAASWFDESPNSVAPTKVENARLVFASAMAGRVRVHAILDTGSSLSVGNDSLRRELQRRHKYINPVPIRILSVTGAAIDAEYVMVDDVWVGDVHIAQLPIAFAGPEPFAEVGFVSQPALLLGMDVLRQFDRVEIDFPNNEVRFTAKGDSSGTFIQLPSY